MRLDERLVVERLADSRSSAQRLVMAGRVRVNGQLSDKSSRQVAAEDTVEVAAPPRFVSRGGDKLANALDDLAPRLAETARVADQGGEIDHGQRRRCSEIARFAAERDGLRIRRRRRCDRNIVGVGRLASLWLLRQIEISHK